MKNEKVTAEELEKSLQYLEAFAKGENPETLEKKPTSEKPEDVPEPEKPEGGETKVEEPEDELYRAHKSRLTHYLDKAMCHKGFMDKIKAGEPLPDEAFDDLEEEEEITKEVKKGKDNELNAQQQEELVKARVDEKLEELVKARVGEALEAQKQESEKVIKGLREQIEALENQPVKKTIIKGADALTLKKALSGEKVDDKVLLSVSLQKSRVSEVLYEAYENESDEMIKGRLGDAVAEFESTGNYISPEIAEIMDKKGYKFIK